MSGSIFGEHDPRSYESTRAAGQRYANAHGVEVGLEVNALFKTHALFMLPLPRNRSGHELRCEVIRPERARKSVEQGLVEAQEDAAIDAAWDSIRGYGE